MLSDIKYYPKQNRYRVTEGAGKGQFIAKQAFLTQLKAGLVRENIRVQSLAEKLFSGELTIKEFEREISLSLRRLHVAQAVLGADGYENMTSQNWLEVGRELKNQYYQGIGLNGKRYGLRYLVNDFEQGKLSEAQLKHRLDLFARNSKKSFYKQEENRNRDKPFAIRYLGVAEHCPECLSYAAMGVSLSSVLPNVGDRCSCGANCKCRKVYLTREQAEEMQQKTA